MAEDNTGTNKDPLGALITDSGSLKAYATTSGLVGTMGGCASRFELVRSPSPATFVSAKGEIMAKVPFDDTASYTSVIGKTMELSRFFVAMSSLLPKLGIEKQF